MVLLNSYVNYHAKLKFMIILLLLTLYYPFMYFNIMDYKILI